MDAGKVDGVTAAKPYLRPPTRKERLAFRLTRRWPDSYVRARLAFADALEAEVRRDLLTSFKGMS